MSPSSSSLTPVHVVVLAAGRGSRLGALTDETPKWLLEVGGRTIADRHLEGIAMAQAAGAVASVGVATGHAGHAIEAVLAERGEDIEVLHTPEWETLNNWWTVLRVLRARPSDEPVAVINSDLLIEPEHVAAFLEQAAAGPDDGLLAVDLERELTDESMKVQRRADGTLEAIGKVAIERPAGEYIGMLMARGAAQAALREGLEAFVDRPEAVNEWYEGAVGRTAAAGVAWSIWPMPTSGWVEIDDDADFEAAQALVAVAG